MAEAKKREGEKPKRPAPERPYEEAFRGTKKEAKKRAAHAPAAGETKPQE